MLLSVKLPVKKGHVWIAIRSVTSILASGDGTTCVVTAAGEVHDIILPAAVVGAILGVDTPIVTR